MQQQKRMLLGRLTEMIIADNVATLCDPERYLRGSAVFCAKGRMAPGTRNELPEVKLWLRDCRSCMRHVMVDVS